ncbi:MAG: hypothetical protein IJ196_00135 [Prevotella sp.]|nr:hypothetical protein [Prevotella sp.]
MNTKQTLSALSLFLALMAMPSLAQTIKTADIPQKVYDYVEFPPHFPSGVRKGMETLFSQRFHYPEEAWKAAKVKETEVSFIVRRDGTVTSVVTDERLHPALADELKAVIPRMPLWYPAYLNGQKIDARVGMTVSLVDTKTGVPYHLKSLVKSIEGYTSVGYVPKPMSASQLATAIAELNKVASVYPEHKPTAVTLSRMQASLGETEAAVLTIDRSAREYELLNPWRTAQDMSAMLAYRPGYNGKDDVAIQLQRAVAFDWAGRENTARRAYDKALQLAQLKVTTGDIGVPVFDEDEQTERAFKRSSLMTDLFYRLDFMDGEQLDDADKARLVTIQRTPENIVPIVDEFIKSGKLKDVKTAQLNERIKKLVNEDARGPVNKRDVQNLYATQVLIVCLRDGQQSALSYVDQLLREDSLRAGARKTLTALRRQLVAHAQQLSNRRQLLRPLACYAPLADDVDTADFHRAAEVLSAVFPLSWLNQTP